MQNLVVTDTSICETPIFQTGISLIKKYILEQGFFLFVSQYFIKASHIGYQPGKCYNNVYSSFIHKLFLKISVFFFFLKPARLKTGTGI